MLIAAYTLTQQNTYNTNLPHGLNKASQQSLTQFVTTAVYLKTKRQAAQPLHKNLTSLSHRIIFKENIVKICLKIQYTP